MSEAERKTHRKQEAERLYKQGFSMEAIALLFDVTAMTISRDLEEFSHDVKTQDRVSKRGRKGEGRPRGKRQVTRRSGPSPEVEQKMAEGVLDEGKTLEQVTKDFGLPSVQHAKIAVAREEGRREPKVERGDLSMSAQQKFDAAMRAYKAKLDADFNNRVNQRVREFLEETILPKHRQEQEQAYKIMRARKGIMDKASFRLIWSALHPDSRKSISDRKLAEAFDVFSRLEKLLLDEKQSPTDFQKLPATMAEWDQRREAMRRAKTNRTMRPQ
jgi:hypothetical protein